ncbi:hypothetical protein [Methanorbis furvi]|uniref:Uncharacterized protein n=1 Tax=Methanorbis furvi TaxID=3028299 RepID=A0AAE4MCH1_9EURY|nr:hypothetical protein [Methanocorpusculaceae archaeon Ag1]
MTSEELTRKLTKDEFSKYHRFETTYYDTVTRKYDRMKWVIKKNPKTGKYTEGGYEYNERLGKYVLIQPFDENNEMSVRDTINKWIVGAKKKNIQHEAGHITKGYY